ncbi:hypothetical protein ACFL0Q_03815 [Thermodesulfobacteriota bacterium]
MKRFLSRCLIALTCVLLLSVFASAADYVPEADALYEKGGMENYRNAIVLYRKALATVPNDYETNWKCARAFREYGNAAKKRGVEGWEKICAEYGKEGMGYALKALEIEADKVDGHYYYGLNVGIYSDGVSILTALREGLKNKTQSSFEKAYELDKMYDEAGPILSLGRFWAVLPWPLKKKEKSLEYYREYQATAYFAQKPDGEVYFAELLIDMGGERNREEAKAMLELAAQSEDKYFSDWATRLLESL